MAARKTTKKKKAKKPAAKKPAAKKPARSRTSAAKKPVRSKTSAKPAASPNKNKKAAKKKAARSPTSATKKSGAVAVAFRALSALFGKPVDDPAVAAVLAQSGKVKRSAPDAGDIYVVCPQAGYDLVFSQPEDSKRGAPYLLDTIFLYADGVDGHTGFADPPFGFTFSPRSELLTGRDAPANSWLIGTGDVPVDHAEVDSDSWEQDGVEVVVNYGPAPEMIARNIQITPLG